MGQAQIQILGPSFMMLCIFCCRVTVEHGGLCELMCEYPVTLEEVFGVRHETKIGHEDDELRRGSKRIEQNLYHNSHTSNASCI